MKNYLPNNLKSQIAVIITFVIAVIILFVAVFINITKVSQVKTTTSTAADRAALSLASQLGSMSHYYKDKVLKGEGVEKTIAGKKVIEACATSTSLADWIPLAVLIGIAVATGIASFFFPPALVVGAVVGAAVSATMFNGINQKFKEMTNYNAFRENTLFQALSSIQSDDVELKVKEPGIFYEDKNSNGIFDTGEPEYILLDMPGMDKQPMVDRFHAWYYKHRLTFLSDQEKELKDALGEFIDGSTPPPDLRNGLNKFIDIDDWSTAIWGITKLSYVIVPGSCTGACDYEITCTSGTLGNCPDWVKDTSSKQLRMVRMDSSGAVYGGFLKDKFLSLLKRLKCAYPSLNFCSSSSSSCTTATVTCSDVDNLIDDMKTFLSKTKEVLNFPVSERFNKISQWFPQFYNFYEHKANSRRSIHDTRIPPSDDDDPETDPNLNNDYQQDIYLRLIRDQVYIKRWITELEKLNSYTDPITGIVTGISKDIESKHGECTWGRGAVVASSCNKDRGKVCPPCSNPYCGYDYSEAHCCQTCCFNPQQCAWEGIYYTCCQNPPVCSNGDLYGANPPWCSTHRYHAPCHSGCPDCNVHNFNCDGAAKDFQGQLAYNNTSGPTEVEQAIKILRALDTDITKIEMTVAKLADKIAIYHKSDDPLRKEIVYAWKDKPKSDGSPQFCHLVRVKIDGYPAPDNFPNVTESIKWGLLPCYRLNGYQGDFTITISRYDQDQPTDIAGWKLRRRKQPGQQEFDKTKLEAMVNDIQNIGKLNPTSCCDCHGSYCQANIDNLLNNYAIMSTSKAHFGPEKSDIKIIETEGD